MRYLRKYNENTFDKNHAVVKIKEQFTEKNVSEMLGDEVKEWVEDGDYNDISNGEAEEIILHKLISWYKQKFNIQLDEEQEAHLEDDLRNEYSVLKLR
jgi:hypothetical protein